MHSDKVLDVVEISTPACMCSMGMDKKIIFFSLEKYYTLKIIDDAHDTGIQKAVYMSGFGGNLVTTSFDFNANVWSPGNIYGDCYLG